MTYLPFRDNKPDLLALTGVQGIDSALFPGIPQLARGGRYFQAPGRPTKLKDRLSVMTGSARTRPMEWAGLDLPLEMAVAAESAT